MPLALSMLLAAALAQAPQIDEALLENFTWRSVGPAGAGGRVVDVEVVGEFPFHIFVATASGGLWRSTNGGVTWEPIFDDQDVVSIGAIAVNPSNPDVLWVGTGEANPRNSVSWGNGVYKSNDGGKSWVNVGLENTHHIGRIAVDPRNPDTVYVAALGHIWAANDKRGLYKTTDGGASWERSLFIDEDTGVIDVAMDPRDSATLYAAAYEVRRDGFSGGDPETMTGDGSAIYKTNDGGRNWRKLTEGLPESEKGRIGIAVSKSDPAIVYAIVQTVTTVPARRDPEDPPPPTEDKTFEDGGVFRSTDRGESWEWMSSTNPRPFYYSQIRVDPSDPDRVYVLGSPLSVSENGGKDFERMDIKVHVDHHDLWINPDNSDHLVLGNDGGIYFSFDRGESWDFLNQIAIGQFYAIDVDMQKPYFIYGGVQDYCSWGGPSATRNSIGIAGSDWHKVMTGDGFQVRIDPSDPTILYAEAQYGRIVRHDRKTGQNTSIAPAAPEGKEDYRFNWETPLHISYHDSRTIYAGGNHLFRSPDRGNRWDVISPELTTATRSRADYRGGESHMVASMSAFAESPLDPAILYAGTDDGHVHVTSDGAASWTELTERVPDMPGRRWVSRLVASRFERKRVYAAFDGHRNDDFAPHLYVSNDLGQSWTSIASNLPVDGPVRVMREDVENPRLLFVGTEFGAFVSFNRGNSGESWTKLMNGMPTVAVADLVVHPRDHDLIAGTHGRSAYVMDIGPLQQMTDEVLAKDLHVFALENAVAFRYHVHSDDQFLGEKRFIADNPAFGATITYYVGTPPEDENAEAKIVIANSMGERVRELEAPASAGLHRVQWDLRHTSPPQDEGEGRGFGGAFLGPLVQPGSYRVTVDFPGRTVSTILEVEPDPELELDEADRRRRLDTVTRLLPLQREAFEASERTEKIKDELEALVESVSEAEDEDENELGLDELSESTRALAHRTDRTKSLVNRLYRAVENSPFAPTATQLRQLDELEARVAEDRASVTELTDTTLPELEERLDDNGIARVRVPSKDP